MCLALCQAPGRSDSDKRQKSPCVGPSVLAILQISDQVTPFHTAASGVRRAVGLEGEGPCQQSAG